MHILEKTEHEDAKRIDLFYQDTKAWKHFLRQFYVNFHPQKKRTLKFQRSSGGDDGIAKALYPLILLSFRLLLSTRPLFCLQLTSYRLSLRL